MLYGLRLEELIRILREYDRYARTLVEEHGVSWWDFYAYSDVGKERLALVEEFRVEDGDVVLDVGCGKGYLTIALAQDCNRVCGLDLMNGFGRRGWWSDFQAEMAALNLSRKVMGVRACASGVPFKDASFNLTVSAHALRNFNNRNTIVEALREMRRVTRRGGRVIIAENIPRANTKAQAAHLKMFEVRTKYVKGDNPLLTEAELLQMFGKAGMSPSRTEIIDFGLSAAPPIWVPNPASIPEERRAEAIEGYTEAVDMVRECGESSPPVLLFEARVD